MGTHPTFSPTTGPAAAYQPKTLDESDLSIAGGVVPFVQIRAAGLGALTLVPSGSTNGTPLGTLPAAAALPQFRSGFH